MTDSATPDVTSDTTDRDHPNHPVDAAAQTRPGAERTDPQVILEAGVCAPSGGNMQRWRFLVVRDPKVKETVGALYKCPWDELVPRGIGPVNRPQA